MPEINAVCRSLWARMLMGVSSAPTKVKWSIPNISAEGVHSLVADFAGGNSVFVANAIPGDLEAGNGCKAKF